MRLKSNAIIFVVMVDLSCTIRRLKDLKGGHGFGHQERPAQQSEVYVCLFEKELDGINICIRRDIYLMISRFWTLA